MSITSSLKKNSKLVKSLIKNNHLKNQQKMTGVNLMNGGKKIKKRWVNKTETGINSELFIAIKGLVIC